jgi:hypothetical protein
MAKKTGKSKITIGKFKLDKDAQRKILAVVGGLLLLILIAAGFQPDEYRYSRSLMMKASSGKIYTQVNNLQNWNNWSPWAQLDPNAKMIYEGPKSGKGAMMAWDGNRNVGKGRMMITNAEWNRRIVYVLDFIKPMDGTATSEIKIEPQPGRQTLVTWSMYGQNNYMGKLMSLVFNCESMMNKQFDQGLANLQAVVEGTKK